MHDLSYGKKELHHLCPDDFIIELYNGEQVHKENFYQYKKDNKQCIYTLLELPTQYNDYAYELHGPYGEIESKFW